MKKILIAITLLASILSNASAMGDNERNALAIIGGVAVVGSILNANHPRYDTRYDSHPRYEQRYNSYPRQEVIIIERPVYRDDYRRYNSYPRYRY